MGFDGAGLQAHHVAKHSPRDTSGGLVESEPPPDRRVADFDVGALTKDFAHGIDLPLHARTLPRQAFELGVSNSRALGDMAPRPPGLRISPSLFEASPDELILPFDERPKEVIAVLLRAWGPPDNERDRVTSDPSLDEPPDSIHERNPMAWIELLQTHEPSEEEVLEPITLHSSAAGSLRFITGRLE